MTVSRIIYLLKKQLEGQLSGQESIELAESVNPGNEKIFEEAIAILIEQQGNNPVHVPGSIEKENFKRIVEIDKNDPVIKPVHRVHFLRTAWARYAAAIVLFLGIGAYFWNTRQPVKSVATQSTPVSLKNNADPGSNKAILTLSDGRKIILDSAANGQLAQQGNATIKKNGDGQITYLAEEDTNLSQPIIFNTMSTPRGGQYQLTLPDGSRVWLNAESSITYPAVFTGATREVSITGEVYFEVAQNAALPFKVKAGGALIEVLGTHFNINAYSDEPVIKTTLLEGSVKVVKGKNKQILKPGQEAQFSDESNAINLIDDADTDEAIAWKNGTFDFRDQDIETVMRQIGRWYNMEIVYEGKKPGVRVLSMISRNTDLVTVLKSLELIGLHFKVEGSLTKGQAGKIIVQQ